MTRNGWQRPSPSASDRRTALEQPRQASSPDRTALERAHRTLGPAVGVGLAAVLVAVAVAWASADPAAASEPAAVLPPDALPGQFAATRADGLRYRIDAFELSYAEDHPEHPPIAEIMDLEIELGEVFDGYVAPREDLPLWRIRLADAPLAGPEIYYGSAIRTIDKRIVEEFARRGLAGLLVHPDENDIDLGSYRDLRPPGRTAMGFVIRHGAPVPRFAIEAAPSAEETTGAGPATVLPPVAAPSVEVSMCASNPQLPALPFEFDRTEITPQGAAVLDSLIDHLNLCESARIRIDGHTDEIGTESYNRDLSERRAWAAQRYLIEAGIYRGRLTAQGLGEADPLAPNTTREGRALNRRVELLQHR